MKKRPEVTDEEILQYMDFQGLMKKHNEVLQQGTTKRVFRNWTLFVAAIALVGATYYLWPAKHVSQQDPESEEPQQTSIVDETITSEGDSVTEPGPLDAELQEEGNKKTTAEAATQANKERQSDNESNKLTGETEEQKISVQKGAESVYNQAVPICGYDSLYQYFQDNLRYPEEVAKDSIEGIVVVSFVISREGLPERIEIVETLGPLFEDEARRLIENMPAWKPATMNGKPVLSKLSIPLTFQIEHIEPKK